MKETGHLNAELIVVVIITIGDTNAKLISVDKTHFGNDVTIPVTDSRGTKRKKNDWGKKNTFSKGPLLCSFAL